MIVVSDTGIGMTPQPSASEAKIALGSAEGTPECMSIGVRFRGAADIGRRSGSQSVLTP